MKIRQLKKNTDLRMVIGNAHDVAVAEQVLASIHLMLQNADIKAVTIKDPFYNDSLNVLWGAIREKLKKR